MSLYERTDQIRRLINTPWKQSALYKSRRSWLQACSALDVIGDTELAVDAYLQEGLEQPDGARYLSVYGLLQAQIFTIRLHRHARATHPPTVGTSSGPPWAPLSSKNAVSSGVTLRTTSAFHLLDDECINSASRRDDNRRALIIGQYRMTGR